MIPKIIHFVWNHKHVLEIDHPMIDVGFRSVVNLNPDWQHTVYTPTEVDYDLKNILSKEDWDLVKDRHFVSRCDLWKPFKLYEEGGFYIDLDRMCNIPLSDILEDGIEWVLPTTREYDFSIDIALTAPKNPLFKLVSDMFMQRLKNGMGDQYFLGPQTYMHAVSYFLCGEIVDTNPGEEKFKMLRDKIAEHKFIKTYREVPYNDMLVYRGNRGEELEWIKRDFYSKENVKHWTGEW